MCAYPYPPLHTHHPHTHTHTHTAHTPPTHTAHTHTHTIETVNVTMPLAQSKVEEERDDVMAEKAVVITNPESNTLQSEENVSISGSNARLMIMKKLSRKTEVSWLAKKCTVLCNQKVPPELMILYPKFDNFPLYNFPHTIHIHTHTHIHTTHTHTHHTHTHTTL